MKVIYTETTVHRNEKKIKLIFSYDKELIQKIKNIYLKDKMEVNIRLQA